MILFLFTSLVVAVASQIIPNHFHFQKELSKQEIPNISLSTAYFTQQLDPISGNITFQQRYLYSEQFSLNKRIVFLYVSGPNDFGAFGDSFLKSAKDFGATIFSLEHRFYGESKPDFENFDSSNLHYLNSFRTVQDIIFFIEYANREFQFEEDVRWILWGTGYGGLIASETRKWDPITVSGVIASSAPLKREFDFWKYNKAVEKSIEEIGHAGCYQNIKEGFKGIQYLMNTVDGRSEISDLFEFHPSLNNRSLSYNEIQMFWLSIIAPIQQIVQFNGMKNLSIAEMCEEIADSQDTVQGIHKIYVYLSKKLTGSYQPMKFSYQNYIESLKNISKNSEFVDQRLWQYQMCTEFGWFYTTNYEEDSMFGGVVPLSLFLNQCFDIFPVLYRNSNASRIQNDIESSQKFSGTFSATNIVFVNEELDLWSSTLGMTSSDEFSIVTNVSPNDGDSIIFNNIDQWVKGSKNLGTFKNERKNWKKPERIPSENEGERFFKSETSNSIVDYKSKNPEQISPKTGFETGTFRQRIDHFDNKNTRFFHQKYYKNSRFTKPNGPNFLMIGGIMGLNDELFQGDSLLLMSRAKKYGATVYGLEHRFYGNSAVENNTDLTTLHSLQALYDLAQFIESVNSKTKTSNPWITFGGFYSGMLSARMRQFFPELVIGAVASSAPMKAKTDFMEFHMIIEKSIKKYDPKCHEAIRSVYEEIHEKLQSEEGRDELSDLFHLSPPFRKNVSEQDKHFFFIQITEPMDISVRFSAGIDRLAHSKGSPIETICQQIFSKFNSTLENYSTFIVNTNSGTVLNNYTQVVEMTKSNKSIEYLYAWQYCTEFGFLQSSDSGRMFLGSGCPVSLQIQFCRDFFEKNFTRETVDEAVERTNYYYGGVEEFTGTNVVFTNGDTDPWSALGYYNPRDESVVSHLIKGSTHGWDLQYSFDGESEELKYAKRLTDENIEKWLGLKEEKTTTMEETTTRGTKEKVKKGSSANFVTGLFVVLACLVRFL